ncbi:hypothetical protein [Bacillus thuringiensis]|uniref:hypothetical protein n=1 Tax=Bacillus thuringiensis TaxID=1428 RepID=UPI00104E7EBD|nr:hypothetical protein [Bacillus thuringiensis]
MDIHIVGSKEEGAQLYQKLFLYVFKKLSKPGIKNLSKEELSTQRAIGSIDKNDLELLNTLQEIWRMLDLRVNALEDKVQIRMEQISNLMVKLKN